MWLTDKFVDRPGTVLIIGGLILILLTFLTVQLEYLNLDPTNDRDFLIWDDPIVESFDK